MSTATALDYIAAIVAELDRLAINQDVLMSTLGERIGEYLSTVEFCPAHEAFSHGEIHFNYSDGGLSGVRLTVRSPMTPASFAERFGTPTVVSTNNVDTHHRERWFVGKRQRSGNRCIIDVSFEDLVQSVLLTREETS